MKNIDPQSWHIFMILLGCGMFFFLTFAGVGLMFWGGHQ